MEPFGQCATRLDHAAGGEDRTGEAGGLGTLGEPEGDINVETGKADGEGPDAVAGDVVAGDVDVSLSQPASTTARTATRN